MNFRPYQPSDLEQVMVVYFASIHSLAAPFYSVEELAAWAPRNTNGARWQQRLATVQTDVAEQSGVLGGFVSYESGGHIDLLFTHPDFARRGVATRLYRGAEMILQSSGVARVFTEASLVARPFFERQGFQVECEEFAECRGVHLRRYRMSKQLGV